MAKLKDSEINGNLVVDGDVSATNLPVSMSMNQIPNLTNSMKNYKTYIGTAHQSNNNIWYDMISVRHENGNADKNGQDYGLMLYTRMQEDGDLWFAKQTGANTFTAEKTILDSSNIGNYAYEKNDANLMLDKSVVTNASIQGLMFGNNTSLTIPCENRGVVKVYIGYNGGVGYIDDLIYIDGTIKNVVRNGTGPQTNYVYNQDSYQLTIISAMNWSYGFAIGSRSYW